MMANALPSVLQHPRGSISMERALKNIRDMLMECEPTTDAMEDRLGVALDDIDTMLSRLDRD